MLWDQTSYDAIQRLHAQDLAPPRIEFHFWWLDQGFSVKPMDFYPHTLENKKGVFMGWVFDCYLTPLDDLGRTDWRFLRNRDVLLPAADSKEHLRRIRLLFRTLTSNFGVMPFSLHFSFDLPEKQGSVCWRKDQGFLFDVNHFGECLQ